MFAAASHLPGLRGRSDVAIVALCGRNPERLAAVARKSGMLLMGCDQCCYQRAIADRLIEGVPIGCFPDLYAALAGARVDQVITL